MTDMVITGAQMMFLLDIYEQALPAGVPAIYDAARDDMARGMERRGLLERHHVGTDKLGAALTDRGRRLVTRIINSNR